MEIIKRSRERISNALLKTDVDNPTTFVILALLITIGSINNFFLDGISSDVDSSWVQALNLAYRENLVYGRDVVFTFGPLGFLTTGLSDYVPKWPTVLMNLLILCAGFHFVYLIISKLKNRILIGFFALNFILFEFSVFLIEAITIFFFAIFYSLLFLKEGKKIYGLIPGFLCAISLFLKLNAGIIAGIYLIIYSFYLFFIRKERKVGLGCFAIYAVTVYILTLITAIDFPNYLKNSLFIIDGYNDAMALMIGYLWLFPFFGSLICCGYLLVKAMPELVHGDKNLFLAFSLALVSYIIFKQSFVRADGHTMCFYSMVIPLMSILYLFINTSKYEKAFKFTMIPLLLISIMGYGKSFFVAQVQKLIHGQEEISSPVHQNISPKELCRLPEEVLATIGDSTTDVFGNSVSYVYFNDLNYKPRPVFQSYVAYNENLMGINYHSWMNGKGPEYLLYHFGTIDDRHPFWDEPILYDAVFQNYEYVETFSSRAEKMILFKKAKLDVEVKEVILQDTIVGWGEEVDIPNGTGYTYAKIWFDYSLINKILRVILQPILPDITLLYDDNTQSTHRMVKTILPVGVPIENKTLTIQDAENFFLQENEGNINTKALKLEGGTFWFNPTIRVQFLSKEWNAN